MTTVLEKSPCNASRSLPTGWKWARLGDVCTVVAGTTPSSSLKEYWDGDIVWITPSDLGKLTGNQIISSERMITQAGYDSCGTEIVPVGSVVMSSRAPIGYLGIAQVPLCTNQGCKAFVPGCDMDPTFLYYALKLSIPTLKAMGNGATFAEVSKTQLSLFSIPSPPLSEQERIVHILDERLSAVEKARSACEAQIDTLRSLAYSYLRKSLSHTSIKPTLLSSCLEEVKNGIGASWSNYPVFGATRDGIAPAKENVGKTPERYKLVDKDTVFYNPMRILIGSIAMLGKDDRPGITSPDYVVFKCREGFADPYWFYHWLRSPYGSNFIKTLARGAVRERILFRRLASATIELPNYEVQRAIGEKFIQIAQMQEALNEQIGLLGKLPTAILRQAFNGEL